MSRLTRLAERGGFEPSVQQRRCRAVNSQASSTLEKPPPDATPGAAAHGASAGCRATPMPDDADLAIRAARGVPCARHRGGPRVAAAAGGR